MVYLKVSPRIVEGPPEGSVLWFSIVVGRGFFLFLASAGNSICVTCWKNRVTTVSECNVSWIGVNDQQRARIMTYYLLNCGTLDRVTSREPACRSLLKFKVILLGFPL